MNLDSELDPRYCGVIIRVIPDYLLNHTLLGEKPEERLGEVCKRWEQFISRLWSWRNSATFCFRFETNPAEETIRVALLASTTDPKLRDNIQRDIEFALAAYHIVSDINDPEQCIRLWRPDQLGHLSAAEQREYRQTLASEFGAYFTAPPEGTQYFSVDQEITENIWTSKVHLGALVEHPEFKASLTKDGYASSTKVEVKPWVPLAWDGAAGSFQVVFRALSTAAARLSVSIYLMPIKLLPRERLWFEALATKASEDFAETSDPTAEVARRLCTTQAFRCLSRTFKISAQCLAFDGDAVAAHAVAKTLQTLCLEARRESQGVLEDPIMGAEIVMAVTPEEKAAAALAYSTISFPNWASDQHKDWPEFIKSLRYVVDARGASTLFRLPISVRGGLPGVIVTQPAPNFDPGPVSVRPVGMPAPGEQRRLRLRPASQSIPSILVGQFENAGYAIIPVKDFSKHALITGFTGSGKTKTVLHLLQQFWVNHKIPFMVLESAKAEYRGLMKVPHIGLAQVPSLGLVPGQPAPSPAEKGLLIFTLGNERSSPLRFNPFEVMPGVRLEAHIGRLQVCFEAALPPFAPLTSILEQSLVEVYTDLGWMTTDVGKPLHDMGSSPFPTMSSFGDKLLSVAESRGYKGDNAATLMAAIRGRILPLTRKFGGSKGVMLDTPRSSPPIETLLTWPVIVELNDLNINDKALVTMFLLMAVREYREVSHRSKTQNTKVKGLHHLCVVEEAHNILENVSSSGQAEGGGADTRYKAVQSLCNMLAEIRALGEGIIIADQSPEKLAPDAMRNTNIQIAHQLRDSRDRDAIANAMIMTDEQREYLGKLTPGKAALFYTGLQKASFVKIPLFDSPDDALGGKGAGYSDDVTDEDVARYMEPIASKIREDKRPHWGCKFCKVRTSCDYRWHAKKVADSGALKAGFLAAFKSKGSKKEVALVLKDLVPNFQQATREMGAEDNGDAAWCYFLHMKQRHIPKTVPAGPLDRAAGKIFEITVLPILKRRSNPLK